MLIMETRDSGVTFGGFGAVSSQQAVAPLGFSTPLAQLAGLGGALVSARGIRLDRDSSLTILFGFDHMYFSDGCLSAKVTVGADQRLSADVTHDDLGPAFAQVMVTDGLLLMGESRVLFTKDGIAVAAFALGGLSDPML